MPSAPKKTNAAPPTPVAHLVSNRAAFNVPETRIETRKLHEIAELLWLPSDLEEDERAARVLRAFDLFESLAPEGGLEGMLAVQMVGTHSAALECLRRAAIPDQTFAGRDMALKHATKLLALYTKQMAALDKHRGKGQQKVTVEHVHVEAGGQAIVGHVEAGKDRASGASVIDGAQPMPGPDDPASSDLAAAQASKQASKQEE